VRTRSRAGMDVVGEAELQGRRRRHRGRGGRLRSSGTVAGELASRGGRGGRASTAGAMWRLGFRNIPRFYQILG
jgi:hypothetical protein